MKRGKIDLEALQIARNEERPRCFCKHDPEALAVVDDYLDRRIADRSYRPGARKLARLMRDNGFTIGDGELYAHLQSCAAERWAKAQ